MPAGDRYLVFGGSGFLGSYIAQALVDRGERHVSVCDINLPGEKDVIPGVNYFLGDILDENRLSALLAEVSPTVVFHTVSPIHGLRDVVYHRINVQGTRNILSTCQGAGVKALVFTSSTSVVWSGNIISGANEEQVQIPEYQPEAYNGTKAIAETMVLEANGRHGMKTAAIRPCGMIGPRDKQAMWRLADALDKRQHTVQMGYNTNLVDFSYAGNMADAHLLAADRLVYPATANNVAGEVFFVTDGRPIPYWNFPRMVWKEMGDDPSDRVTSLPKWICLLIAFITGFWCSLFGGEPPMRPFNVRYATCEQWYNIDKARKVLGYEPRVPLEEAVRMMVAWWVERGKKEHEDMCKSKKSR